MVKKVVVGLVILSLVSYVEAALVVKFSQDVYAVVISGPQGGTVQELTHE